MTTQIDALANALAQHGLGAATGAQTFVAGVGGALGRIYLNGYGRDISAYIELDEPERDVAELEDWAGPGVRPEAGLYEGAALRVYSDAAQGRAWRVNRAKQVKHEIMTAIAAAMVAEGCPAEFWTVTDDWREVIL